MKRIYKSYKLRVINEEGEKYIKLNGNIDSTSYRTMVKYYHKTKDKYQDEDCTVEMVGVYPDGEIGRAIFSKTFCKETMDDKELLISTDEIVEEIKGLLELLDRKNEYHKIMYGVYNKKQDLLLHKIESIKSFNGSRKDVINEKLNIINKLEEVRHDRRFNKQESKKLQTLYNKVNIEEILNKFSKIKIPINTEEVEYIDNKCEEKIIKEIKYNSEKQRVNLTSQIQHKYDKIVDDKARGVLICYNYGYTKNIN